MLEKKTVGGFFSLCKELKILIVPLTVQYFLKDRLKNKTIFQIINVN